jgi:hypothetical protein
MRIFTGFNRNGINDNINIAPFFMFYQILKRIIKSEGI